MLDRVKSRSAQDGNCCLVVSGTPPGSRVVGEIVLRDLIDYCGVANMACIAITPSAYPRVEVVEPAGLRVTILRSSHVRAHRWTGALVGSLGSLFNYFFGFRREVKRLVRAIVKEARENDATRIFAVLDNPLVIAVAHRVSTQLGIPLVTLVWDAPDYLLRNAGFDRLSRGFLLRDFEKSLATSQRVAVVSLAMQQEFARHTRAPVSILRHGVPAGFEADTIPVETVDQSEWVIGFAGAMYADCAWRAFLRALDVAEWKIAGRPVRLKIISPHILLTSRKPARVDFLGSLPTAEEAQAELNKCDLCYLPQAFASHLHDLSRFSFPTKLTSYLATGRPVFIHSPPDGSLSAFYEENPVGVLASSLQPDLIIGALESLLGNPEAYAAACRQTQVTAKANFSETAFHSAIDRLLGKPSIRCVVDSEASEVEKNVNIDEPTRNNSVL